MGVSMHGLDGQPQPWGGTQARRPYMGSPAHFGHGGLVLVAGAHPSAVLAADTSSSFPVVAQYQLP